MKPKSLNWIALLAVVLFGCSPLLGGGDSQVKYLQAAAEKQLRNASFRGASWSLMAVDLTTNRILLARDEYRALIPASGVKLLVTACALETLGPDYHTATNLGYTGQLTWEGKITGDLVVLGAGDPSIASRFSSGNTSIEPPGMQSRFAAWADSLRQRGIQEIEGGLIGYTGLFQGEALGSGWEWNDLAGWWSPEVSSLIYADNCVEVTIAPADTLGAPALITLNPPQSQVEVRNAILTSDSSTKAALYYNRELAQNKIVLWGSIPQNSQPQHRWISIHDPAAYFLTNLQDELQRQGIKIGRPPRTTDLGTESRADFKLLFSDPSPPLRSLIQIINQHSHNLYSEILIRLLGRQRHLQAAPKDTVEFEAFTEGRDYLLSWHSQLPGPSSGLSLADGSGLSRRNLAGAGEFLKVLAYMNRSPHREVFLNSLVQPGTGTLQNRFLGLPNGIGLRAKSGTLSRARSLSGYLSLKDQPQIAFSLICNNFFCAPEEIDRAMENLLQLLALYLMEKQSNS